MSPTRRTQQERSAATRSRLLKATFECLVERGYCGTTTPEVLRRAGTSRGAMLHHYPSRAHLVTAALQDVIDRRLEEFRGRLAGAETAKEPDAALIDLMWELMSGPTYYAWLELVVAARTDEELRGEVRKVNERFDRDMEALHNEITSERGGGNLVATQLALATLQGLAVSSIYEDPDRLTPVRNLLRRLAAVL